jgi:uncharacterized OB-fold protein
MTEANQGPDAQYLAYLAEGRFMIQQAESGVYVFPPRLFAPGSGEAVKWVEPSGLGTVYSTTTISRKPPAEPYNVSIVELDEGPRLLSRVTGRLNDVRIGQRVEAFIGEEDGAPILLFRPAGEVA